MPKYVSVHFPNGCVIGRVLSEQETTLTVEFDNIVVEDIPKEFATDWVS